MNEFDGKAREWDKDKMHMERSRAIAVEFEKMIPLNNSMRALEYGAGTGILSFLLKDHFNEIILMDSSQEMIKVCEEKVKYFDTKHIKPIFLDLQTQEYHGKFDVIYNQMVLHHVVDTEKMFEKFYALLNPDAYLVVADLYPEDGSFHGFDVKVHLGFEPAEISKTLEDIGFRNIQYKNCFTMKRESGKSYPIFLLSAQK